MKRYRDKRRRRDVALRGSAAGIEPEPMPVEELERELRSDA